MLSNLEKAAFSSIIISSLHLSCRNTDGHEQTSPQEPAKLTGFDETQIRPGRKLSELYLSATADSASVLQAKLCLPEETCPELTLSDNPKHLVFSLRDFFSVRSCDQAGTHCGRWQLSMLQPPEDLTTVAGKDKQSISSMVFPVDNYRGLSFTLFEEGSMVVARYMLLEEVIRQEEDSLSLTGSGLLNGGNYCFVNSAFQFFYRNTTLRNFLDHLDSDTYVMSTKSAPIRRARENIILALEGMFAEWDKLATVSKDAPDYRQRAEQAMRNIQGHKELFMKNFDVAALTSDSKYTLNKSQSLPDQIESMRLAMLRNKDTIYFDKTSAITSRQSQKDASALIDDMFSQFGLNSSKYGGVQVRVDVSMDPALKTQASFRPYSNRIMLESTYFSKSMQEAIDNQFKHYTTTSLENLNKDQKKYSKDQSWIKKEGSKGCFPAKSCFRRTVMETKSLDEFSFTIPSQQANNSKNIAISADIDVPYVSTVNQTEYLQKMDLTAVTVRTHSGSGSFGHWYTFIKENGSWYKYNDSTVSKVSWETVRDTSSKYGLVFNYHKKPGAMPVELPEQDSKFQAFDARQNKFVGFDRNASEFLTYDAKTDSYRQASSGTSPSNSPDSPVKNQDFDHKTGSKASPLNRPDSPVKNQDFSHKTGSDSTASKGSGVFFAGGLIAASVLSIGYLINSDSSQDKEN